MPSDRDLPALLSVLRRRFAVPALGAAVVRRSGEVEVHVVGERRRGGPDPVLPGDQWHIGSCGKAITAALYARLVERGDAAWDAPVRSLFPDLTDEIDRGWSDRTIDEVLTCRSGMRANLTRAALAGAWSDPRPVVEQRTATVAAALADPPDRRGAFRYSNLGYVVAGAAIERLAGVPFEAALRMHLLEPLGIGSGGFGPPPDIWGHRPRLQLGSLVTGRGAPADPADSRSDNPPVMTPAGRLHLSLADWAKFQRMILDEGGDFLRPSTVTRLLALPPEGTRGMAMGWASARRLEGASYGMQGSNTMWAASALIDAGLDRTAMVVANDGRTRVLAETARLAARILR